MALLRCQDLAFAYEGKTVLDHVTFQVDRGDYLSIIGENGSGKTTLLKGLLGLLRPKSGSIKLGDGLSPREIGYVPQQSPNNQNFPASVYEVVLSGRLGCRGAMPFYSKKDKMTAFENMDKMGILSFKKRSIQTLSGGQRQRMFISRALCAGETLLLLDEPTSGLDPLATAELYKTIQMLNRDMGIAILLVSHDIQMAVEYGSHVLHLQNRPLFCGKTEDYKQSEVFKKFSLGGC